MLKLALTCGFKSSFLMLRWGMTVMLELPDEIAQALAPQGDIS